MSTAFSLILLFALLCLLFAALVRVGVRHEKELHEMIAPFSLKRACVNPVLSPDGRMEWESGGVFNPAAWYDGLRVHLFYRAIGEDGVSRIGYASSADGLTFDERLPYPIYILHLRDSASRKYGYDPEHNPSGGGWAGTEDPRVSEIDGRVYLSFTAFDGWGFIRMAATSLSRSDAIAKRWQWRSPVFLSPPGQIHKNWVLFPEKIGGKFAVLHSISPSIEIEYVDDIEAVGTRAPFIESAQRPRGEKGTDGWDTWVRGVGPSPIKTSAGWLVLYHAMDKRDPDKYKLGAMLLDLEDPSRVIARAPEPILSPDAWYENDGKPGVVYACGAVVKDGELFVYYGGGDKHVCVAHAPLEKLILWMNGGGARARLV